MSPLVTFVTRCYNRPKLLQNNINSVTAQASLDWEQIFLLDQKGRGIVWANDQLHTRRHKIKGDWVFILDDDCRLLSEDLVAGIARTSLDDKNVVMVRSSRPQAAPHILPPADVWGSKQAMLDKPSKFAVLNCLCYIVRRDLWMKHIRAFGGSTSGAWTFAAAFLPEANIHWFDVVVAETQQLGRGKKIETVKSGWWDRIVQRNALQPDGAIWRRNG